MPTYASVWQQMLPLLPPSADPWRLSDHLQDDLGLDSLDCVELVLRVERHFAIRFPDEELFQLRTLLDLVLGIERHLPLPFALPPLVWPAQPDREAC